MRRPADVQHRNHWRGQGNVADREVARFQLGSKLAWARYGLGELDPFDRETVAALLEALKTPEEPSRLSQCW